MLTDGNNSPEAVSSRPAMAAADEEEELDLGLCLGGKTKTVNKPVVADFCRILTAEDFPSMPIRASASHPFFSPTSSSDSSSPSSTAKTKPRQLVGWPPVRAHRLNNFLNPSKRGLAEDIHRAQRKTYVAAKNGEDRTVISGIQEGNTTVHFLVKVNKDGDPIGRKVNVNAHSSYESLALALEDMFQEIPKLEPSLQISRCSKMLDSSSDFVLTYEDRDGDCMLVGDVPWRMFLKSVRRLRIMKRSEANGLG